MTTETRRWVLSGGLACGKSKVRELLEAHDIATVDADSIGHAVLEPGGPAFSEAAARWPRVVVQGTISRSALAQVVFNDPDELAALESITHPHIFGIIKRRVEKIQSTVVVEIPLLAHGLGEGWGQIVVDCRDDVRLARAIAKGMSASDARARMTTQATRSVWLAQADIVIPNHSTLLELASTVARIVPKL